MFCENCGLQLFPQQSVCTRCGATSTRHWFQLMSLVTLLIAAACNSLAACLFLPRLAATHQAWSGFRVWQWMDGKLSLDGWVPLALGLFAWKHFVWQASRPAANQSIKEMIENGIKCWILRTLLVLAFLTAFVPLLPPWIRPPAALVTAVKLPRLARLPVLGALPGVPGVLPWGLVALAAALVCIDADTRDSLLGHGRMLGAVSLGVLAVVLTLILLAFAA